MICSNGCKFCTKWDIFEIPFALHFALFDPQEPRENNFITS